MKNSRLNKLKIYLLMILLFIFFSDGIKLEKLVLFLLSIPVICLKYSNINSIKKISKKIL